MFSEDEDSDDGDLFSSNLGLMSSPDRPFTRHTLLEDEEMHSPPPSEMAMMGKRFIFEEEEEEEEKGDYLDSGSSWLSQIFFDNDNDETEAKEASRKEKDNMGEEQENRPPRLWRSKAEEIKLSESNHHERSPLQEIRSCLEDEEVGDDLHTKKKSVSSYGKPNKMRYMRTLSPTRLSQRKESSTLQ